VERERAAGGASTNTGTLQSKTLRESALYFSGLRQRGLYGIDYSIKDELTVAGFIHRYPTLSEMYKYAAYDGRGNLSGHTLRDEG